MPSLHNTETGRVVAAFAGRLETIDDPDFELDFAIELSRRCGSEQTLSLFYRFAGGESWFDGVIRRICFRALVRRCGKGISVGRAVCLRNPETFEIGDGVIIGDQVVLQGRHDGRFVVGDKVWIGAQCFLDTRDLVLEDFAGLGPGVRVLGSQHTGQPLDVPIVTTDLLIKPVRVAEGADIGVGAVLMPGVTVGAGAIVGAGAVVTHDVPPLSKVAGAPACVIGWRDQLAEHVRTGEAGDGEPS